MKLHLETRRQTQIGVSLVELMVGSVIGLLVVLAALGSLGYTLTASKLIGDSTRLQQDAATAFRIIGNATRQAGARRLVDAPGQSGQVVFNPRYIGIEVQPRPWQPVWIRGTEGESGGPDLLEIHRDSQTDRGDSVDCLGEATVDEHGVQSTFSVHAGLLRCDGSGATSGTYSLIQGVEDFQVWYGLREGNGLRYTTASDLNGVTPAPWDQVETVRICLRLAGELTNNPGTATRGCHGEVIQNDGRLRRVFYRVFKLRNVGI